MKEWVKVVQRMIDWVEEHTEQSRMLDAPVGHGVCME